MTVTAACLYSFATLLSWQGPREVPLPASFQMKVGNFTQPAATGNSAVTGVGFKPRAVVLFAAGNENAAVWEGTGTSADKKGMTVSMFVAADQGVTTGGASLFETSDDAGSVMRHGLHQRAFRHADADGTVDGVAQLVTMDADGFTLNWTTVPTKPCLIGYIALAGDALVAKLVKWQPFGVPGVGEQSVRGIGFRPDVVLHIFGASFLWDDSDPPSWPDGSFSMQETHFRIGAMDKYGNQWGLDASREVVAPGPTDAHRSFFADRAMYGEIAYLSGPEVNAKFVSMDDDGFTLLFNTISTNRGWVASLALGGIEARVGTIDKPTSTQSQATAGIGFQPKGLILASAMSAVGTNDGILAGVGAGTSSSARVAVSRADRDNVDPAVSLKRTQLDKILYGPDTETTHADLTSLDADGWTLAWTTSTAAFKVGYIALGAAPRAKPHLFEAELNGVGGGWTDLSGDVLLQAPAVSLKYGIGGTGPLDLVASTGTMKFSLNNSEDNSAGLLGYYSPRHANCRLGFQLGIRVRYTYVIPGSEDGYGKFIGRLREIEPEPGQYRDRKTHCLAVDWMNEAAITRYNAPTQIGKRSDEILATIVALVPRQPDTTDFDVANSTYPYALDNGLTEGASVLTEIQRICQSEYGRCHMHGGLNSWGTLYFENRTARLTPSPVASFDGTMQDLDSGSGTGKIKNKSKVTAHPRRVDGAATTVLFAKPSQNNPQVAALAVLKLSGRYVDPANPNARVGGTDMVTPTATTDYLMNANADGSGADRTANFTVSAVYGANQVDYTITNNHASLPAYVTKLQARGRGIYDYDPLDAEVENAASIDLIGESVVQLDMPYQSDYTVTQALAQFLVDTWSAGGGVAEASIKYIPRTEAELTAAMALEPGHAIVVQEDLSVVNDVYFIQNVGIKISGDKVTFDWDLQRALVQDYWALGSAGFSELGVTTVLAPL